MPARKSADTPAEELGFEEALERLESVVEELEGGQLPLEQSLRHYEEGMRLSKRLAKRLDEAERTIERLTEPGEDDAAGGEPAAKRARKPGTQPLDVELRGSNDELPF